MGLPITSILGPGPWATHVDFSLFYLITNQPCVWVLEFLWPKINETVPEQPLLQPGLSEAKLCALGSRLEYRRRREGCLGEKGMEDGRRGVEKGSEFPNG